MKTLVVLASICATIFAGTEIIGIPGDNSNYVEGESRYIWMAGDDGEPFLVDLQVPVNKALVTAANYGSNNEYWLFTRQNPDIHQLLVHKNESSVTGSNFLASRQSFCIVHGYLESGNSEVNSLIKQALLTVLDCNVIVVDWRQLANNPLYPIAAAGVTSVGENLGNFLIWLFDTFNCDWNTLHIVGFSLGAHGAGIAGRTAGGLTGRITGLDPAGPGFSNNSQTLNTQSGKYVEVIHTDGGVLGMLNNIGHADFYPNGGKNPQPSCWNDICSHCFSYRLYSSTVYNGHLIGVSCTNVDEAVAGQCAGSDTLPMGNANINKTGGGIFALTTDDTWPY